MTCYLSVMLGGGGGGGMAMRMQAHAKIIIQQFGAFQPFIRKFARTKISRCTVFCKVNPICCIDVFYVVKDGVKQSVSPSLASGHWTSNSQSMAVGMMARMPVRSCGTMQMVTTPPRCLSGVVAPCKWLPPLLLLSGHCPNLTSGPPPQGNTRARSGVCAVARVAAGMCMWQPWR